VVEFIHSPHVALQCSFDHFGGDVIGFDTFAEIVLHRYFLPTKSNLL